VKKVALEFWSFTFGWCWRRKLGLGVAGTGDGISAGTGVGGSYGGISADTGVGDTSEVL
jgi:hypothetical protein